MCELGSAGAMLPPRDAAECRCGRWRPTRIAAARDTVSSLPGSGAVRPMPEAQIAQAVQLLDLILEHFADGGHWRYEVLSSSGGRSPAPFWRCSRPEWPLAWRPFPRAAVSFGTQAGQIELAPPSPPMCRCLHALELGRGADSADLAQLVDHPIGGQPGPDRRASGPPDRRTPAVELAANKTG